ncbi:hypothetical protein NQ318_000488 [Aromia moschata]|uniref:ABC-2 type transporter transmembrane domain-containing protein n=1 Tax=Aromia moschata TaxID=1265417 RepID=A0AAV8YDL4_9CUCU|nr:hypothetical protein NQ318_000488 [Aromia moschata]
MIIANKLAKGSANNYEDNKNLMNNQGTNNVTNDSVDDSKDVEKANVNSALLNNGIPVKQPRYGNSELQQFYIILRRALLFSRRDWNGVFLAPVMSVPFLLFSGFFVSFDAIPIYLRWITYLSYIRYGFEGTALATYGFDRPKLKCFAEYCHFKSPKITLEELDMDNSSYSIDIIALVAIFFVLRVSAFIF